MAILVLLKEPESSALRFDALAALSGLPVYTASSLAEAAPHLPETQILITLGPHLGADAPSIFARAPKLKWVQLISTGVDNVAEHLAGRNVCLTNARGLHGRQMSEAALCSMLALARQLPRAFRNQAARKWDRFPSALLAGKTVGIVGLGSIAETLGPLCAAFGMRVVGITGVQRPVQHFHAVYARADMVQAVADIDYLVLLTPYSAATRNLIDASVFQAMKHTAFLINLARGSIVDETALLLALDTNKIAGAAIDVFETEPLPEDNALWRHEKVIVTPHIAGFHEGYSRDVFALIADNLSRFLSEGPEALVNQVNIAERLPHAAA